jgi:Uma2 family endonuclease
VRDGDARADAAAYWKRRSVLVMNETRAIRKEADMGGLTMAATETPNPTRMPERNALWETWENLDLPPGSRAEILRGAIYVSPSPMSRHNLLFSKLARMLHAVADENDWAITTNESIKLPATDEAVIPDLIVIPSDELDSDTEWLIEPDALQLVVEITSASTRSRDLTIKLESYAKANIPIYLIVDRLDGEGTVTVHHQPDGTGRYLQRRTVPFGDSLQLPKPFDIELDTRAFKSKQK